MRRSKDMHDIQEMIRLHRKGIGAREAGKKLGISPNCHLNYRRRLASAGLLDGSPDDLPSLEQIRAAIPVRTPPQQVSSAESWRADIEKAARRGIAPKAIHDHLRLKCDAQGKPPPSYDAVKRLVGAWSKVQPIGPDDVVIPVETDPGDVAQVDFGHVGVVVDPATGKRRPAWVFVMTLGFSRHMFARVVFDQSVPTWLALHAEAFAFFDGVPATIVPDNLKAAVIRAAFRADDKPEVQRAYRDCARHYGFVIDPTPVRSPEDKGKVERAVDYVKTFLGGFEPGTDIVTMNRGLDKWNLDVAAMRIHGTHRRMPLEVFLDDEQPTLRVLPEKPFLPTVWKQTSVTLAFHVRWREQWWSVPWNFACKKAWIQANERQVRIYVDDVVVAEHDASHRTPFVTDPAHRPEGRAPYVERSVDRWLARADELLPDLGLWLRDLTEDGISPLRTFQRIILFLETLPQERIPGIIARARRFGITNANELRSIVRRNLDLVESPDIVADVPPPPAFHRAIAAIFQAHQEAHGADLH